MDRKVDRCREHWRYETIAAYFLEAIQKGSLLWGEKMPSLRKTSSRFQCSVSTVTQAYTQLERQGWLEAVEKSGYFIRCPDDEHLPKPNREVHTLQTEDPVPMSLLGRVVEASCNPEVIPLGAGIPDPRLLPLLDLQRSITRAMKDNTYGFASYTTEAGVRELRVELSRRLIRKGMAIGPSDIILTQGCTEALFLAVQAVTQPGDAVVMESPAFPGILQILSEMGRKVIPLPTSASAGVDKEALEEVLRSGEAHAAILTALYQNPLGFCMKESDREEVVALCINYGVPLIEDDVYSDCSFLGEDPRPFKAFDSSGMVLYCGSFSKLLGPGMRIGWIVGGRFHDRLKNLKLTYTLGGSPPLQYGLAEFLRSSRFDHHIRGFRSKIAARNAEIRRHVLQCFPEGTTITQPSGGLYLWVELSSPMDTTRIFETALRRGISLFPGEAFSVGGRYRNCMRISCGYPVDDRIRQGIDWLGEIIGKNGIEGVLL